MKFRNVFLPSKISRYKVTIINIVKYSNFNASNFLPPKLVDNLTNTKNLDKEVTHLHSPQTEELSLDSSLIYMIDTKDKWYFDLLCPNLPKEVCHKDSLISELQKTYSVDELFEVLNNYSEPLNHNQACQVIYSISNIKHLRQFNFKNSIMHIKHSRDYLSLISSHPQFHYILNLLNDTSSDDRLCTLMMCLDNIGIKLSHNVMINLHIKALQSISLMDIQSLSRLSFVFVGKSILSYYSQVKIFNEMKKRINFDKFSLTDFLYLSILYHNMTRIISKDEKHEYALQVKSLLDGKSLNDSDVTSYLLILNNLNSLFKLDIPVYEFKNIMKLFVNRIDTLSPQQLAVLIRFYSNTLEPRSLLPKLQESALNIIHDFGNIALKTDLLRCLSIDGGLKKKKELESIVAEIIDTPYECQDIGSLYKVLRNLKPSNNEICRTFWMKCMENIKARLSECVETLGLKESILRSFYAKYMYFNNSGTLRNFKSEEEMIAFLQSEIYGSAKHVPTKLAHMIGFLVAYSTDDLPDEWFDLLEKNTSQLQFYDVSVLSKGLQIHKHANFQNNKNTKFLSKLKNLLDCVTANNLKNTLSLRQIMNLTTAYLNRGGTSSSSLFQMLSDEHGKYLEEVNSRNIVQLVSNFRVAKFINSEVFESISDYIIANQEDVHPSIVNHALLGFYNLGYYPKKQEFIDACQAILISECERMSCKALLESCLSLAFLGDLPSQLIHHIFRVEFLEDLEEEIEQATETTRNVVRYLLMMLNRAVCLEYPELKIPWFHEKYCKDMMARKPYTVSAFQKEVADVLSSILGDKKYIAFNTKSSYYINIDLEFAVGSDGIPVSLMRKPKFVDDVTIPKDSKSTSEDLSDIKRFAVLPRRKGCYTSNDYTLLGFCEMQRKHLEMLGYIVVEVLEKDFYSMAIPAKEDKEKFLKNLLVKEAAKFHF